MLTAPDLKAAWQVATELFLDIEMAGPAIIDLCLFQPGVLGVASLDHEGNLQYFPIQEYGRFRLAYDELANTLYVGLIETPA
jgi:hypothetical protein